MPEPSPINTAITAPMFRADPASGPPRVVPQPVGAGPLWRSLLSPHRGQRALELDGGGSDLFGSLREAGVRFERSNALSDPAVVGEFDLVLDDRTADGARVRADRVRRLLAPEGRWVIALEKKRWVGLAGRRLVRRVRRAGFDSIRTFHAYPSLRSPRILVPLDSPEAFRYFLHLAVGVRAPRQRLLALGARCLCALRLHEMVLPNLIVVARRTT